MSAAADQPENSDEVKNGGDNRQNGCLSSSPPDAHSAVQNGNNPDERREKTPSPTQEEEREKNLFKCNECKKVFDSYQALGGHRSSHWSVKGCAAQSTPKKKEVAEKNKENFECKRCKEFGWLQGLGGHIPHCESTFAGGGTGRSGAGV